MKPPQDYCDLKQSQRLKALGFNELCHTFYNRNLSFITNADYENHNSNEKRISAPTIALASSWLRKNKRVEVCVIPLFLGGYNLIVYPKDEYGCLDLADRILINQTFQDYDKAHYCALNAALDYVEQTQNS